MEGNLNRLNSRRVDQFASKDAAGHLFDLTFIAIIGQSSLLEYTRP
jgi:hypothetical protein